MQRSQTDGRISRWRVAHLRTPHVAFGVFLLGALSMASLAQTAAESKPTSRPAEPTVVLPVSTTVKATASPTLPGPIELTVFHVDPPDEPCEARAEKTHCPELDHWRVRLGRGDFRITYAAMRILQSVLNAQAQPEGPRGISERVIAMRVDADAGCLIVQRTRRFCAEVGFYKIEYEVAQPGSGAISRVQDWCETRPSPPGVAASDEIGVALKWNFARETLSMKVAAGTSVRTLLDTPAEWEVLKKLVSEKHALNQQARKDVPVLIDADPKVPWAQVVRTIDAIRSVCNAKATVIGWDLLPGEDLTKEAR